MPEGRGSQDVEAMTALPGLSQARPNLIAKGGFNSGRTASTLAANFPAPLDDFCFDSHKRERSRATFTRNATARYWRNNIDNEIIVFACRRLRIDAEKLNVLS
jgi:hypothetical protein